MCELATIAAAVGTVVSAYAAYQQGQSQSQAAKYQSEVNANNAQVAAWNAEAARNAQAQKTQAILREGALREGAQRAALGASGVNLDSPSALNVLDATVQNTARNAEISNYQGDLAAYGYRTQQSNFTAQSGLDAAASGGYATAGMLGASGSLLSGAGQVADRWYRYRNPAGAAGY